MIKVKRTKSLGDSKPTGLVLVTNTGSDLEDAEIVCNFMWGKDFHYYKIFKNKKVFSPNHYELGDMTQKLEKFN